MIDLKNIANTKIFTSPFKFGLLEEPFLNHESALKLVKTFPTKNFERCGFKNGHFLRRPLIVKGENKIHLPDDLDQTAIELGEVFLSDAYRNALIEITGLELKDKPVEAWFWTYDSETKFEPHLDYETKIFTQVFYITEHWEWSDGGLLQILNSENTEDVAFSITPRLNLSSMIFRSDDSWHYLTPISPKAAVVRNSITVHFHHF
jgi:Rps23 Pro-64 3,4-dihydroxylase Tpa1-like proline 4-hydroxylase